MLRKTIIFAVCAISSASLPALYQQHQATVLGFFGLGPQAVSASASPVSADRKDLSAPQLTGRRVELSADGRGHFNGEFRLNGRPVPAMIDTGASVVALNRSTARRLGISPSPADFRHEVSTANGRIRAAAVTIDRLQIGRIDVEKVDAMVLDDAALEGTLIGMSFLRRLAKYQVEDGKLRLEQ